MVNVATLLLLPPRGRKSLLRAGLLARDRSSHTRERDRSDEAIAGSSPVAGCGAREGTRNIDDLHTHLGRAEHQRSGAAKARIWAKAIVRCDADRS